MITNLHKTAILFIDLINDFNFRGGDKLLKNMEEILPNLLKLRRFAEENQLPIIYINDHYQLWQANPKLIMNYCLNNKNEHILKKIKPKPDDYFLIKPQHSAFYQTPLQSLLQELGKSHLLLAGVAGDICVLFTAKDAYMYQYDLTVPANCIASEEKTGNEYALYLMNNVMKANINPI
ncbi:isochorismatase family cysteine hydrolase [Ornithinibacillus halotolerans]|uniref:Isochorismatase family protein YaaI n=1 Tax=Ornithinibacillus halotolerans TaxID=1274357 RepID=A0A916RX76_9BACI|nr:isochorismatase family cysteine hydrolase [Ornithinibacillus halotolerans]GGA70683.1 putative isochorismatase family protein YaaI [Ornithinibacillus halotolerans]